MENSGLIVVPREPPRAARVGEISAGLPTDTQVGAPYPNPSPAIVSKSVHPQPVAVTTIEAGGGSREPGLLPVADVNEIRSHADAISQRGADLPANRQETK